MRGQPKRGKTKKKGRWNGYMEGVGGGGRMNLREKKRTKGNTGMLTVSRVLHEVPKMNDFTVVPLPYFKK